MRLLNDLAQRMPGLPSSVLVGVSGGADSVALLMLLRLQGCDVRAVHVNHALRGEASDGDEAFVRSLCREMNVPLTVFRLQPPEHPGEDWARRERYRCFREALEHSGAQALALAHHRDDQAETLLLHLMRGAGLTGLTGMAAETDLDGMQVIRPLLGFTRQELQDALTEAGITWREDESNQDNRYLRNAIRSQLLPLMERLSPGCGGRIAATAKMLQADEAALQSEAEAFLARWAREDCILLEPLVEKSEGEQRRILRRWWQQSAGRGREERSLSREQTAALQALVAAKAGTQCNLPGERHGYRGWTHLHITPSSVQEEIVFLGECPEGAVIRTWQTGDWLSLKAGKRRLQDFFTDRKVDAPFRRRIPLLCRGGEVLSVAGIWPRDAIGCWQGDMPWVRQPNHNTDNKGE